MRHPRVQVCKPWSALPEVITAGSVSRNGRYLALTGFDGIIHLCDLESGSIYRKYFGNDENVVNLCFSADDETIISRTQDGIVHFWHVSTGSEMMRFGTLAET